MPTQYPAAMRLSILLMFVLSGPAAAAPKLPGLPGVLAKPDPDAAVAAMKPAVATVHHLRRDGSVERHFGVWLDADAGLMLALLDKVVGGEAIAVEGAGGIHSARLVAADGQRRTAILQVPGAEGIAQPDKIVLRYPKAEEILPLLSGDGKVVDVTVVASTEHWIEVKPAEGYIEEGAALVDPRGGLMGVVVPGTSDLPDRVLPAVHVQSLLERARGQTSKTRTSPTNAQEACLAMAMRGGTAARGCVDPRPLKDIIEGAAVGALAVYAARTGDADTPLSRSGWNERVAAMLEFRAAPESASWVEQTRGELPPIDPPGLDEHELIYDRSGLRVDKDHLLDDWRDRVSLGVRVVESVQIGEDEAWVRIAGDNLDGSEWSTSRHWVAFGGRWSLDVAPNDEALASLPPGWPACLDEGDWLRGVVMNEMIAHLDKVYGGPEDEEEEPEE